MSNGGFIGTFNAFSPTSSGRWSINDVRQYILDNTVASIQSPLEVSNLYAWLDASYTASITSSGGLVSSWGDRGPNAIPAEQTNSTYQPTTNASTLNGNNVLTFTGSQALSWQGLPSGDQTVFAVIQTNNTTNTKYLMYQINPTSPVETLGTQNYAQVIRSGSLYFGTGIANRPVLLEGTLTTSPTLISYSVGSKGSMLRINKTTIGTYPPSATPITIGTILGASTTTGSNGWSGSIAEVIVYSQQISEIQQVENYLSTKWGV